MMASSYTGDKDLFFRAISLGRARMILGYLDAGIDVNMRDDENRTPLMQIINFKRDEVRTYIVRLLLQYGVDVNAQDNDGRTALMYACVRPTCVDVVRRIVLTGKCEPNIQDLYGETALFFAVRGNNPAAIRILSHCVYTKSVMDSDQCNIEGESPLLLAYNRKHSVCCRFLIQEAKASVSEIPDLAKLKTLIRRDSFLEGTNPGRNSTNQLSQSAIIKTTKNLQSMWLRNKEKENATDVKHSPPKLIVLGKQTSIGDPCCSSYHASKIKSSTGDEFSKEDNTKESAEDTFSQELENQESLPVDDSPCSTQVTQAYEWSPLHAIKKKKSDHMKTVTHKEDVVTSFSYHDSSASEEETGA